MRFLAIVLCLMVSAGAMGNRSIGGESREVTPETRIESREPTGFQEKLWKTMSIRSSWVTRADQAVDRYVATKERYLKIERMRKNPSVPARVIFVIHGRESTWNFNRHLHEGSPLSARTRWVPKGRPVRGNPPFTFEESAEDALYLLKDMENWDWSNMEPLLQNLEKFNGLGYQKYRDINSPYMWSGSNHYERGKYTADSRYSRIAVDKQIGVATILKRMHERNIK